MKYSDLTQLLLGSSSTRRYFLSLPVEMQMRLHEHNNFIHTAEELRKYAMIIDNAMNN